MCVWLVKRPLLVSVSEAMLNHPNVDLLNAGMSLFLKLITVPITDQIGSLIHQLVTGITLSSPLLKIRSMLLHEYLHHATYSTVSPVLQDADSYSPDHDVLTEILTQYAQEQRVEAKIVESGCLCALMAICECYQDDLARSSLVQWCTQQATTYSENAIIAQATLKCLCRLWKSRRCSSELNDRRTNLSSSLSGEITVILCFASRV